MSVETTMLEPVSSEESTNNVLLSCLKQSG
jgi:hypothetical protein